MKIAIAGATGFLGGSLKKELEARGHQVLPLGRKMFLESRKDELKEALEGSQVVINLAGKPLLGRWTKRHKQQLFSSRVELTQKLVEAINSLDVPPKLFVSASAIGCYPSNRIYSEYTSHSGCDYISWLCHKWEHAAHMVVPQVRLAVIRISPVLAREGGILSPLFKVLRFKINLKVGSAGNCFSWIHISDFINAILFIIDNESVSGVINLCAPGITTNDYMSAILSDIMQAPVRVRIPNTLLKMAFGCSSRLVSSSKAIYPAVLLESGFNFRYPYIKVALEDIVGKP